MAYPITYIKALDKYSIDWTFDKTTKYYLDAVFTRLNINTVECISVKRTGDGSSHTTGKAIDIHALKFNNGEYLVFHDQNYKYNKTKNEAFILKLIRVYNALCLNFAILCPEYMYRNYGAMIPFGINNKKSELEIQHTTHLHITIDSANSGCGNPEKTLYAINENPQMDSGSSNSSVTFTLLLIGAGYYGYKKFIKKDKKNEKEI